jgi:cytoskeletal protein RodZ
MVARRNNRNQPNGEMPLESEGPGNRIELGAPPEIDITNDKLGELFLARRRALGLKVEELAEDIKIKADYIRAIEKEEFHLLPTPQYARLFVKSYAERLGFNIAEIFALLDINAPTLMAAKPKVAAPQNEPTLAGPLPGTQVTEPGAPRHAPRGPMLWGIITAVIIILALLGWIIVKWEQEPATGEASPNTTIAKPQPVAPPEPQATDSLAVAAEDPWETLQLDMQFDQETWAALLADGENVESRVFNSGERLSAFAAESFRLSLGHTQGVHVWVNDRPLRPFVDWTNRLEAHLITRDSVMAWIDTMQAVVTPVGAPGGTP